MTPPQISHNDPYIGWRPRLAELDLSPGKAALLVIDMQYADASMDHGIHKYRRDQGLTDGLDHMAKALDVTVRNTRRLLDAFRARGIEVVYTRIRSMTNDGRERSLAHRELRLMARPDSKDARILAELAPQGDEMIFDKTTGSVFLSTTIHYALSNMGIENLVMTGVMSSGCVESAARDAKDLGYRVIVVDDASCSWTAALHDASMRVLNEVFAKVKTTDEVLAALPPVAATARR
ncbi:MAG: cysteine hydrolase [Armatimonadetes bacterium]|nr:cysteine hydrolase [Armatimonadota bacterium]